MVLSEMTVFAGRSRWFPLVPAGSRWLLLLVVYLIYVV
jgi:hypothetical protein